MVIRMKMSTNLFQNNLKRSFMMAGALVVSAPVFAQATFLIWPIYPKVEANEKASAVWLQNTGKTDAMVQIRVYEWNQAQKKDNYSEQNAIIPSPPVAKIKAGEKHMLRLTKSANAADGKELAYRIIVDELPIKFKDDESKESSKVSFQMRYSIPLFVYGKGLGSGLTEESQKINKKNPMAKPILTWSIQKNTSGQSVLQLKNSGHKFSRLTGVKLSPSSEQSTFGDTAFGYVLANSTMQFELDKKTLNRLSSQSVLYGVDTSGTKQELIKIEKEN